MMLMRGMARRGGLAALAVVGAMAATSVQAQEAKKSGTPNYTSAWKMDLAAGTKRIAVADVTEDKKPRLLVLNAEGKLTVHKLSATATAPGDSEGAVSLGEKADKFAVGHFAKGKPAVIAVPGAIFYREGEAYSKKAAGDLTDVSGSVRFTDGGEYILIFDGQGPPTSRGVDLSAANLLTAGPDMPEPKAEGGSYREVVVTLSPELQEHLPLPEEAKKGGILRLVDPRSDSKLFGLLAWQTADSSHAVLVDGGSLFSNAGDMKPLWKSPKLAGKILDIAPAPDPRGSKQQGFLVLQATGADGKGRLLEFFALD